MNAGSTLAIEPADAALLVIDIQQRLAQVMPGELVARLERNVAILAELARRFELPVVLTRQYPKGLGDTITAVREALEPLGEALHSYDKIEFSACEAPAFEDAWSKLGRRTWLVVGMETHVCVYQSVRQLCQRGASVHVLADAVCSRTRENHTIGLELMRRAGAFVSATEVACFDVLRRADSEHFKALSRLIK